MTRFERVLEFVLRVLFFILLSPIVLLHHFLDWLEEKVWNS